MQKYANSVQDTLGNAISVATVTVYTDSAHTALATIYSDNGITPTTNPRTTDSLGEFSFYAADGRYYIKVTKSGITTQFLDDVILFDPTASSSAASINTVQSGTGAVSRSVSNKLEEIKSLDDFGATGDGSTDDATNVQKGFTWLGGASYRQLVGVPGKTYKVGSKISVTGSYSVFDGRGCNIINAISATPADPLFELASTSTVSLTLRNFTVSVVAASTKGHCISILGNGANPQDVQIERVGIYNHVGSGKDSGGSSMTAYGIYAKSMQVLTLRDCNIVSGSGGMYVDTCFKVSIQRTTVDQNVHHGLFLTDTVNTNVEDNCIFNGNGGVTESNLWIAQNCEVVNILGNRFKTQSGYQITTDLTLNGNKTLNIRENRIEVQAGTTNEQIVISSAVIGCDISDNDIRHVGGGGPYAAGILIAQGPVGTSAYSGRIVGNNIYCTGSSTVTVGIKFNVTTNTARAWVVESNTIGGQGVASVFTTGIHLAGNGADIAILNNNIGEQSGGSVTTGVLIGSGHTDTVYKGNWNAGATPLTDSGVTTQRWETGSWTPVITFATPGDLAVTYGTQVGRYIRNGKLITVTGTVITSAFTHTTAANGLRITGLPVAANSTANSFPTSGFIWQGITKAGYTSMALFIQPGNTYLEVQASGSGQSDAVITKSEMPTGGTVHFYFSLTYETP